MAGCGDGGRGDADAVAAEVVGHFLRSSRHAIFIEGIDASGKTRFARRVVASLRKAGKRARLVKADYFLIDRDKRIRNGASSWRSYLNSWFDFRRMREEILVPFFSNQDVKKEILVYSEARGKVDRPHRVSVARNDVLVVEGVFLSNSLLKKFPAYRVVMHVPFRISLERQVRREPRTRKISGPEAAFRWENWHLPAQKRYMARHKPESIADVVIDNSDYHSPCIAKMGGDALKRDLKVGGQIRA